MPTEQRNELILGRLQEQLHYVCEHVPFTAEFTPRSGFRGIAHGNVEQALALIRGQFDAVYRQGFARVVSARAMARTEMGGMDER